MTRACHPLWFLVPEDSPKLGLPGRSFRAKAGVWSLEFWLGRLLVLASGGWMFRLLPLMTQATQTQMQKQSRFVVIGYGC